MAPSAWPPGKVLDLTRLLPGPLAGKLLLEMGFPVLKVEPPGGPPEGPRPRGLPLFERGEGGPRPGPEGGGGKGAASGPGGGGGRLPGVQPPGGDGEARPGARNASGREPPPGLRPPPGLPGRSRPRPRPHLPGGGGASWAVSLAGLPVRRPGGGLRPGPRRPQGPPPGGRVLRGGPRRGGEVHRLSADSLPGRLGPLLRGLPGEGGGGGPRRPPSPTSGPASAKRRGFPSLWRPPSALLPRKTPSTGPFAPSSPKGPPGPGRPGPGRRASPSGPSASGPSSPGLWGRRPR